MSKPFPDTPFLSNNFAPWSMEGDIRDLVVEGEIPAELRGAYYRNGSNPQFAPGESYHWFEGDGMVHAFYFEDGRCHYKNRFVRTERFEIERAAGRALFAGFGPQTTPEPLIEGKSPNASNTNVVWHAGKLLSLWEAGPPYELDPETLETIGIHDYDGAFYRERFGQRAPDIMTAHPKPDPDTGEWIGFGYSPLPPYLVYHTVDRDGRLTRSIEIDAPFPCMMHDFITTAEHAIFPCFPAIFNVENMLKGGSPLTWEPERGTQIGVLPRDGGNDDVVWIEHDPCFVFHPVNAHSDNGSIVAEVWQFPRLALFEEDSDPDPQPPTLHRWTIDAASGSLKDEVLDDAPGEFGRIDQRYMGKAYRDLFSLGSIDYPDMHGQPEGFNCIFHYDVTTGQRKAHRLDLGDSSGEPIFVPRSPDAEQGDGFVLAIVHRARENRSDFIVLDARNIEAAPLARIRLPHRIPYGFHGNWRPGDA